MSKLTKKELSLAAKVLHYIHEYEYNNEIYNSSYKDIGKLITAIEKHIEKQEPKKFRFATKMRHGKIIEEL